MSNVDEPEQTEYIMKISLTVNNNNNGSCPPKFIFSERYCTPT